MPSSLAICLIVETLPPKKEDPGEEEDMEDMEDAVDAVDATGNKRSEAESCRRVLTTHIGFVAEPVTMPAMAAAHRCT